MLIRLPSVSVPSQTQESIGGLAGGGPAYKYLDFKAAITHSGVSRYGGTDFTAPH